MSESKNSNKLGSNYVMMRWVLIAESIAFAIGFKVYTLMRASYEQIGIQFGSKLDWIFILVATLGTVAAWNALLTIRNSQSSRSDWAVLFWMGFVTSTLILGYLYMALLHVAVNSTVYRR